MGEQVALKAALTQERGRYSTLIARWFDLPRLDFRVEVAKHSIFGRPGLSQGRNFQIFLATADYSVKHVLQIFQGLRDALPEPQSLSVRISTDRGSVMATTV